MGTLNWVAPECLDGSVPYDEKCDIYRYLLQIGYCCYTFLGKHCSFGTVLWEIMSGKTPYEGKSQLQVIRMIDMRETETIPPTWDPDYSALIRACWNDNPSKRPTIEHCLERLEEIRSKYD